MLQYKQVIQQNVMHLTLYSIQTPFYTFELSFILAWVFVTRSCLKPQNPCSNHEIHVLFEHGFYLKRPKLGPDLYDVTLESASAVTHHFTDAFVRENVARI